MPLLSQDNKMSSLVVVGTGIKFASHLTTEAKIYIQQSNKVLYLVNDPAMKEWLQKNNPNSESLDEVYSRYFLRIHCYRAIKNYILDNLYKNQHVCVVLYGHPAVFSQPALAAVHQAKREGYYAKILPGISAEDCLFADLLVDPGSHGCQSFEATDFLIRRRQVDFSCHLILWQVGVIGVLNHPKEAHDNTKGAKLLFDYLNNYYDSKHKVTLYEAALYPHFEPTIERIMLKQLPKQKFSAISTLYIPPIHQASCDEEMLKALGINIADLQ